MNGRNKFANRFTPIILIIGVGIAVSVSDASTTESYFPCPVFLKSNGRYIPRIGRDRWGYIDIKGNIVMNPRFVDAEHFREGLAAVYDGSDEIRYIDKSGQIKVANAWKILDGGWMGDFRKDGVAKFCTDFGGVGYSGCGFIDRQGNFVIKPKFTSTSYGREKI